MICELHEKCHLICGICSWSLLNPEFLSSQTTNVHSKAGLENFTWRNFSVSEIVPFYKEEMHLKFLVKWYLFRLNGGHRMPDNSDNKPKKIELLSGMMLGLHRREQSISSQLATTETKIDNFLFTVVLGKTSRSFTKTFLTIFSLISSCCKYFPSRWSLWTGFSPSASPWSCKLIMHFLTY